MVRLLGRRIEFDEASRDYPIRRLLGRVKPRSYTWSCDACLNQKESSACVGFTFAHELIARPKVYKNITTEDAHRIYKKAQDLDQWPGNNYLGSSILGGVKAIQELYPNAIKEYRWAFGIKDVIDTLGYYGPIALGINWFEGFFYPDKHGYIHRTGKLAGGHAILAIGVNVKKEHVILHNSWGRSWGINGRCYLSFGDLDKLLKERGEACVPVKRGKI